MTGAVRESSHRPGTSSALLGIAILAAFLVPSRYAFTFFAGAVTPAVLFGLGLLWLWLLGKLAPNSGRRRYIQPAHVALGFVLWSGASSYTAALLRPTASVEGRSATIGLVLLLSWTGIGLFTADGIRTRHQLDALLKLVVVATAVVAAVGLLQYTTGIDPAAALRLPGLDPVPGGLSFIGHRSGVRRVAGLTSHPIEFGVLMALVLPLAIHYARTTPRGRTRNLLRVCLPLIAVGLPISVSRSAVVGFAVCILVLIPAWGWRERLGALGAMAAGALLMVVFARGLGRALSSLFTNLTTDQSVAHRAWDYGFALPFIAQAPILGRGFRTFVPQLYAFVDNQYLMSVLETGILGICALLGLFLAALWALSAARGLTRDPGTRGLIAALTASICAAAVTFGTFDALSFPLVTELVFLLVGGCAALWRITTASGAEREVVSTLRPREIAGVGRGLTVVTVTRNSAANLPAFFAFLGKGLAGVPHQLVIADNCSTDDTLACISDLAPRARVVRLGENRGYAAGINAALAASGPSEAVLILNPDVRIRVDLVEHLLAGLRGDRVGIAVPRQLGADGRLAPSLRRAPTVMRALGEAVLGGRLAGRFRLLGEVIADPSAYEHNGTAEWASGSCLLVSRACLLDVGAWDETFFLYSEETDFMLRARDRGWRLAYIPTAVAIHGGGDAHQSPPLWSLLTVNRVRLFALRHGAVHTAAFWSAVLINELLRAMLGRRPHMAAVRALLLPPRPPMEVAS